jgi:hypothetical protein
MKNTFKILDGRLQHLEDKYRVNDNIGMCTGGTCDDNDGF